MASGRAERIKKWKIFAIALGMILLGIIVIYVFRENNPNEFVTIISSALANNMILGGMIVFIFELAVREESKKELFEWVEGTVGKRLGTFETRMKKRIDTAVADARYSEPTDPWHTLQKLWVETIPKNREEAMQEGAHDLYKVSIDNYEYFTNDEKEARFDYDLQSTISNINGEFSDCYQEDFFKLTNVVSYKKRFSNNDELAIYFTTSHRRFLELTSISTRSLWVHFLHDIESEKAVDLFRVPVLQISDIQSGEQYLLESDFDFEKIYDDTFCYRCKNCPSAITQNRVKIKFQMMTIIRKSVSRVFFRIVRPTRNFSCSFHAKSDTGVKAATPLTFLMTATIPDIHRDEDGSKCRVKGNGWVFKNSGVVFPWDV